MHLQREGLRVLAISGSLTAMHARIVPGREIVVADVAKRMTEGRFTDEQSLALIDAGLRRLRQEILSAQEVSA